MTTEKSIIASDSANKSRKRPTLKDIAFMTGLGVTTVSRALNDAPDISESTKERVRLIAKQIGYRPNRAGVRLRTGKTNVVSLILGTEAGPMGMAAPFVASISEYLRDTNYHLVVTPYHLSQDPLEPVKYVVETGAADGIILSRTIPNDPRIKYLSEVGFPFVTHGRTDMGIEHAFFDFDNEAYSKRAVGILADRGRESIGLIAPPANLTFSQHLTTGFAAEIATRDLLEIPIRKASIDSTFEEIQEEIERILRSRHPVDGIICASANAAIAALAAVSATGMVLGEDIDIVAKEAFDLLNHIRPDMIVIREDFLEAGSMLVEMLLKIIGGDDPKSHQVLQIPLDEAGGLKTIHI